LGNKVLEGLAKSAIEIGAKTVEVKAQPVSPEEILEDSDPLPTP
jgi:hypothetical protein